MRETRAHKQHKFYKFLFCPLYYWYLPSENPSVCMCVLPWENPFIGQAVVCWSETKLHSSQQLWFPCQKEACDKMDIKTRTILKCEDEKLRKSKSWVKSFKNGFVIFLLINLAFTNSDTNTRRHISSQTREAKGEKSMDTKSFPLEGVFSAVSSRKNQSFLTLSKPICNESFTSHSQQKINEITHTHTQQHIWLKILSSINKKYSLTYYKKFTFLSFLFIVEYFIKVYDEERL